MLHSVRISFDGASFVGFMNEMRTWLDRHGAQPASFRQTIRDTNVEFRVEFKSEKEADAFATAFAGRVVHHEVYGETRPRGGYPPEAFDF